ncbi:hypothetical protein Tco_0770464 [Tanacetum coccineum]|uniref:Uncharacterized protein n=1 Tax=Tanacetum coccineum TaxID=301880 RepID=A0ABQ4ZG01_9ASTR
MPTETELTLEQTQQGVSHEVSFMDPVTLWQQPLPVLQSQKDFVSKLTESTRILLTLLTQSLFDMKRSITSRIRRLCKMVVEHPEEASRLPCSTALFNHHHPFLQSLGSDFEPLDLSLGSHRLPAWQSVVKHLCFLSEYL